jgi:quercetin dioxygenase-like cupin family protein
MPAVKTPYRMNIADVPPFKVAPPSQEEPSEIDVRMVYGTDTGMMIAARQKGYHSRPHWHDSEQFNYVLDGEIWFFIGKDGFRCRKGDFVRVPRNEIHWTWVRAESGCTMLETHTPSLTGATGRRRRDTRSARGEQHFRRISASQGDRSARARGGSGLMLVLEGWPVIPTDDQLLIAIAL